MALDVLGAVDQEVFAGLLKNIVDRNVLGCITLLEEIIFKGRELSQFVADFVWYLRNILLVKTSDNLEDVIDASSENLERLRQQAEGIEIDALMHHIRAFSELSGKIKYATQKRVMIEMLLIKLCKPEMETSQDALLDRIRALEEKIESGAFAVNMAAPSGAAYESAPSTPVVKKTLDRALPDDVKQVIRQWAAIRNDLPLPMKTYLKTAKLSLSGDDRLLVVLEDGLSSDYFLKQEGHKEFLQDKISEAVDKQILIDIQCVKDDREFDTKYVDLTAIQFDIDEIEDEAEEFI
jgi:DNA polymerase-3 subunit gamma/tau